MSRSCPRVASPSPAFSTLITSAPNQAKSCVQVGPDCTWVKSRMRTPSSARPACPHGFDDGRGAPFFAAPFCGGLFARSFTTFLVDFLADFFAAVLDFVFLAFFRVVIDFSPRHSGCRASETVRNPYSRSLGYGSRARGPMPAPREDPSGHFLRTT